MCISNKCRIYLIIEAGSRSVSNECVKFEFGNKYLYNVHTSISVYDKKQFWAETVIVSLYISRDILGDSRFYYELLKLWKNNLFITNS